MIITEVSLIKSFVNLHIYSFAKFFFVSLHFNSYYEIIMAEIEIGNKKIELDGDGFMVDPSQWNDELAAAIAKADGIEELTENHWKVVRIIRSNFEEKGLAPMVRTICKETGLKLKDIYELFPLGPARGACRVAGLPKPDGCV